MEVYEVYTITNSGTTPGFVARENPIKLDNGLDIVVEVPGKEISCHPNITIQYCTIGRKRNLGDRTLRDYRERIFVKGGPGTGNKKVIFKPCGDGRYIYTIEQN
ncbi:MAG: hypothetical protein WCX74_00425 [Candidatus Paceibacterota bacterium]